jgi:pilus assembly protein CpaE
MATSGSRIKVLIVDDIAETRENIRKILQFEPDMDVVGMARTGREGIQAAREHKPNVILMDINMPDMDGIQATEVIAKEVPSAQIIIVSVQNDTDYLRRAMLAGARDFLPKPPPVDEMINTIRRLGEMSRQREVMAAQVTQGPGPDQKGRRAGPDGKIIAVYSPKGGVGCTTIAVNLSIAMHDNDNRVVVVDANRQFGDAGVFFYLQSKNTLVNILDQDLEPDLINSVAATHGSGVKVIVAPPTPEDAELVSATQLRKVLDGLRQHFAYVVVDTASALTDVELTIFDAADRILLVATPDIPTLANVKKFFDLVEKLEYPPEKVVLVLNRVARSGGISAANVSETIKHTVKSQIMADEKVLMSINQGVPFITGPKNFPPAQGVLELAQKLKDEFAPKEVEDKKKPAEDKKKPGGLFQRR